MKRIPYKGGIVSFSIPDHWLEEYEEDGCSMFYEDKPESGALRLNVITAAEPNLQTDRSGTDALLALFDGKREPGTVVRVLDNGNVLRAYTRQEFEHGEELLMHHWEVANRADANHIRLAIFSFAILASRASDTEIIAQVALLNEQLPRTQFWKGAVSSETSH